MAAAGGVANAQPKTDSNRCQQQPQQHEIMHLRYFLELLSA